jgi:hypothetical protein
VDLDTGTERPVYRDAVASYPISGGTSVTDTEDVVSTPPAFDPARTA